MKESKKEILTITIYITKKDVIKGNSAEVSMIYFSGQVDCDLFKGSIIHEGIDTQINYYGLKNTLSARYMLKGVDNKGEECQLFIENNAIMWQDKENENKILTVPKILTDSKELAWMETSELSGEVEVVGDKLLVHIYKLIK